MKSNQEVVKDFYKGKASNNLNMRSTGDKLFSWNTVIAQRFYHRLLLNTTWYSQSTTRQLRLLEPLISRKDEVKIYDNIPIDTADIVAHFDRINQPVG